MFPSLFLLPLPLFLHLASALLNVTIDDTDAMITYEGSWEPSATHMSGLDYGGTHTVSGDTAANATFTFTGVAVYYLCPRWPYAVNTEVTLDDGQSVIVNLTDPAASTTAAGGSESAQSSVVWSATGLTNATHKLVLTMAPQGEFIVADGFIYTVNNGSSAPSSASAQEGTSKTPSATLAASSSDTSEIPSKNGNTLAIAIGSAAGAAAIIAALGLAFFFWRRRRHEGTQRYSKSNVLDEWGKDAAPVGVDAYPPPPEPFYAGPTPRTSLLAAGARDRPASRYPMSMSEYHDDDPRASMLRSASVSVYSLPPGARPADPSAYADDDPSEASSSSSIARSASTAGLLALGASASKSGRGEKSRPLRAETYAPAPPAYSES